MSALAPALPYGTGWLGEPLLAIYLRGQAHLARRDGAKAAAEFERLRGGACATDWNFPCTLAALQLARAHAIAGDAETARTDYARFIAQWKDADKGVPVLEAALAEYASLTDTVASSEPR